MPQDREDDVTNSDEEPELVDDASGPTKTKKAKKGGKKGKKTAKAKATKKARKPKAEPVTIPLEKGNVTTGQGHMLYVPNERAKLMERVVKWGKQAYGKRVFARSIWGLLETHPDLQ